MTAEEYRNATKALHLSHPAVAAIFGVSRRTPSRWAVSGPPKAVDIVFGIMRRHGLTLQDIGSLVAEDEPQRIHTPPNPA
jgi:hypothetical protein